MSDGDAIRLGALDRAAFDVDFVGDSPPVEYLWDYLKYLQAQSFVREGRYVDRHYLDDFSTYYARSWRVPAAHCARWHFFSCSFETLRDLFASAYEAGGEDRRRIVERMQDEYLGFVVKRPLEGAPIGRTVLRTYPFEGRRYYPAARPYPVHIGGLTLTISGLAFQQQDRGAAVCASTALWSALQKVARQAGHRTPTPSEVTRAAASPFTASFGLNDQQMSAALAELGYGADFMLMEHSPSFFKARVGALLRSQLPVVLSLSGPHGSHAITLTGYREPDTAVPVSCDPENPAIELPMRSGSLHIVYAHDDNHGFHVHYELLDEPPDGCDTSWSGEHYGEPLWLYRGRTDREAPSWWRPDCLLVESALVPKPSKVRLSIDELFKVAGHLRDTFNLLLDGEDVWFEVAFTTGVEYRQKLFDMDRLDKRELLSFSHGCTFPRHVGVVSAFQGEDLLLDLLLDATTVDLNPDHGGLLAIVAPGFPLHSPAWSDLVSLSAAGEHPIPMIVAPATTPGA